MNRLYIPGCFFSPAKNSHTGCKSRHTLDTYGCYYARYGISCWDYYPAARMHIARLNNRFSVLEHAHSFENVISYSSVNLFLSSYIKNNVFCSVYSTHHNCFWCACVHIYMYVHDMMRGTQLFAVAEYSCFTFATNGGTYIR